MGPDGGIVVSPGHDVAPARRVEDPAELALAGSHAQCSASRSASRGASGRFGANTPMAGSPARSHVASRPARLAGRFPDLRLIIEGHLAA